MKKFISFCNSDYLNFIKIIIEFFIKSYFLARIKFFQDIRKMT